MITNPLQRQVGFSLTQTFLPRSSLSANYQTARAEIPVNYFINHYQVKNSLVIKTLHEFPTLCFMLGKAKSDLRSTSNFVLSEGSGIYGLQNRSDAELWNGIFNHVLGTTRQVYFIATKLSLLTADQIAQFAEFKIDINSFSDINPELLRDFMLTSHAGRRASDEKKQHKLIDRAHLSDASEIQTLLHMWHCGAPRQITELMRIENLDYLANTFASNVVDNICTYCDWTFGQQPQALNERFTFLRTSNRAPADLLDKLQAKAENFESALLQIVGSDTVRNMLGQPAPDWEVQIRESYWKEIIE